MSAQPPSDNNNTDNDELVSQFLSFTGSSDVDRAQSYLEMSGGDLETAVGLFMEHTTASTMTDGGLAPPPVEPYPPVPPGVAAGTTASSSAAAASSSSSSSPYVRAPDETRRMRLMDHDDHGVGGGGGMGPFPPGMNPLLLNALMQGAQDDDDDDDYEADRLMERASAFSRAAAVVDPRQAVNAAAAAAAEAAAANENGETAGGGVFDQAQPQLQQQQQQQQQRQPQALGDMFAPPRHLMYKGGGGFQGARAVAKDAKRWLLVNIQRESEFASHALNRDVWRDDLVENLAREGFIFFQTMDTTTEGRTFCQRYAVHDFPHVSILDPRTGRLMWRKEGWTMERPLTSQDFAELAMDFCSRHSLDKPPPVAAHPMATSSSSSSASHKRKVMSESEELQAAMQASLNPSQDDDDDDDEVEYLGSSEDAQEEEDEDLEPTFVETLLDFPVGEEPSNGGARIQIRMPNAKVVRKFALQDTVKSIYAFVVQSNEEVKGGKEFALLAGFPPKDLIDDIDKTVESCGLSGQAITFRWRS